MVGSPNKLLRGGLAAGVAFSLVACGAESRTSSAVQETPSPSATVAEVAKVALRLQLDPNQVILDRLDPNGKAIPGGELDLHVLKVYKGEKGGCSDTAIKLTLDRKPIPTERDLQGNVDLTVDLPLGHESTQCAAAYVAGPNGRTRGEYVGRFAVGQNGWEFHQGGAVPELLTGGPSS